MNPETKLAVALDEHGFKLKRAARHKVWQNACGAVVTTASTPSDVRAYLNAVSNVKRAVRARERDGAVPTAASDARLPKQPKRVSGRGGAFTPRSHQWHAGVARLIRPEAVARMAEQLTNRNKEFVDGFVKEASARITEGIHHDVRILRSIPEHWEEIEAMMIEQLELSSDERAAALRATYDHDSLDRYRFALTLAKDFFENIIPQLPDASLEHYVKWNCEKIPDFELPSSVRALLKRIAHNLLHGASRADCEAFLLKRKQRLVWAKGMDRSINAQSILEVIEDVAASQ